LRCRDTFLYGIKVEDKKTVCDRQLNNNSKTKLDGAGQAGTSPRAMTAYCDDLERLNRFLIEIPPTDDDLWLIRSVHAISDSPTCGYERHPTIDQRGKRYAGQSLTQDFHDSFEKRGS
jgi:hypothetical protein